MTDLVVSAVVLAAGRSVRMGDRAKLLLDVGGMPMIRRSVSNVLGIHPAETVVVTGHRAAEVAAALAGLPVRLAHNPSYGDGQATSVAAGVRALRTACDAVLVLPGDQPLVTPGHLRQLIGSYAGDGGFSIVIPQYRGLRGTPVLFAARHIPAVAGGGLDPGCRRLIETRDREVARIEFEDDVFVFDCDTPDDYRRLLSRMEGGV